MNENIFYDVEQSTELVVSDTESVVPDTELGQNDLESSVPGSGDTGDLPTADAGSSGFSIETYYNAELGGYPVVIVDDISNAAATVADYEDYYTTMSTTFTEYFSGVLANMGDTDYLAYCLRDYANSGYSSYTDHYVMFYDLTVEEGNLVAGNYPYMDIYRETSSSGYVCSSGSAALSSVPFPAYGSFGTLSDIRKGVSHDETWTLLFAVGVAVVYVLVHDIFNTVMHLSDRRKG